MIIKKIIDEIEYAKKPVTALLTSGTNSKLIAIGLAKGVLLKKHKAPGPTKLIVLKGKLEYLSKGNSKIFSEYDEYQIPLEEVHSVVGIENSVFLLSINK